MGNVITINEGRPDRLSLAMSNQGTWVFLDLLVKCALSRELTWSQFDLIDFLCERININITAPGTVSFDIEEMPWDAGCVCEDKLFMLNLTEMAKDPQMWKTLVYQPEEDIVFPWLDTFAQMIGMFSIENSGREYPSDPRKSKLHFKKAWAGRPALMKSITFIRLSTAGAVFISSLRLIGIPMRDWEPTP